MVEAAPPEEEHTKTSCGPATYGEYPLRLLAQAWHDSKVEDTLVDLGAGVGRVLAAAALLTNMSARGIELSDSRAHTACGVLELAKATLTNATLGVQAPATGADSASSRIFEVWRGDLLRPPPEALSSSAAPSGRLVAFSYCNCFGDNFIDKILRLVSSAPHPKVTLMISKMPKNKTALQEYGLHRVSQPGIHTYVRELSERKTKETG
eukprot:gnl/TRDRNA2_/TRDRNA2_132970_c0_seq1.p1 gnl/TRDRNA2_/TRDRNA2_132970_c0~~gnl/TRDRNA2_/TRDRNA2_132970_c0_seq1.p1  ORF type:complete len:232 (+),score=37.18 gnl/TRDRNA2_/TRDRNA2_132970_c0_seq1:75-698(+)